MPCTTLNSAVLTPIPVAIVTTTIAVNAGAARSERIADLTDGILRVRSLKNTSSESYYASGEWITTRDKPHKLDRPRPCRYVRPRACRALPVRGQGPSPTCE